LSRESAVTAEAVAEEDADACVSIRFISMLFYQLRNRVWQRQSFNPENVGNFIPALLRHEIWPNLFPCSGS